MSTQVVNDVFRAFGSELSRWTPQSVKGGAKQAEKAAVKELQQIMPPPGHIFVRLAGISGALALALGAYGTHVFRRGHKDPELIHVFETGSRYHIFHSIALLAVPLTKRPHLVGSLFLAGMLVFSGSCYVQAMTGNRSVRQVTPYGGMLLIAAWLAIVF